MANLLENILERGRLNARATTRIDNSGTYRFESYTYGIGAYYRVNEALKAVYHNSSRTGDVYVAYVDGQKLPKTFRQDRTCIEAIVAAAKAKGII